MSFVTERFEDPGQFRIEFDESIADVPEVLESLTEIGHIIVTPQWIPHPEDFTESAFLGMAYYTGVVLVPEWKTGPLSVWGQGLEWWLGNNDTGPILFSRLSFDAATLDELFDSTASNDGLLPPGVSQGTITTTGVGTFTGEFDADTFSIEALRTVSEALDVHRRINPDFTVDACLATRDDVYQVTTPAQILVRRNFGEDPRTGSVEAARVEYRRDGSRLISRAIIVDEAYDGSHTIPTYKDRSTNPYYDGRNNQFVRNARFSRPSSDSIDVDTFLTRQLEQWNVTDNERVDVADYVTVHDGTFRVGDTVGVFDPPKFIDTDNEHIHRGETIWPKYERVIMDRWAVLKGMGVYYRPYGSSVATSDYIDLTRYVKHGTGRTIEVGKVQRRVRPPTTVRPPTSGGQSSRTDFAVTEDGAGGWAGVVNLPTLATGDLGLAFIGSYNAGSIGAATGWTQLGSTVTWSAGAHELTVWYKVGDGTDTSTATWNVDTGTYPSAKVAAIVTAERAGSWSWASYLPDVTGSSNSTNPPSVTPSHGSTDYRVYAIRAENNRDEDITGPSGYTKLYETNEGVNTSGQPEMQIYEKDVAITTSEDPGAYSDGGGIGGYAVATCAVLLTDPSGTLATGDHTHTLDDASDVTITGTPADNEVLAYDTGSGEWINQTATEAGLTTDHGSLTGLSDDDHTQYSLVDGSRAFSGTVSGVTPTASAHLATKSYVDAAVPEGAGELLMQDGVTSPPVPIETEARDDWLYEDGETTGSDGNEDAFYAAKAAQLDPSAYTFSVGTSWSVTVPAGKAYYLLNMWNGEPTRREHRRPYPMTVSAGTTLSANGTTGAFIYYCDPSAVTASRAKYFERMQRLEELTQYTLDITISSGTTDTTAFPTDFTDGLVIGVSTYDVGWVILRNAADTAGVNLWDEVSDTHGIRQAGSIYVPFDRTTFPNIMVRRATDHSLTSGTATITYVKLPADW